MAINGSSNLKLLKCRDFATNSFPVPFSPVIKIGASETAAFNILFFNSLILSELPINSSLYPGMLSARTIFFRLIH